MTNIIEWRDESFWSSAFIDGHALRVMSVEEPGGAVLGWVAVVTAAPNPSEPHTQFKWSRQFNSREEAKEAAERTLAVHLADEAELGRVQALIASRMSQGA